ncbi:MULTISPECIES: translesion error-prone DNA polymerase V autoproteolytic subunit [Modicisalibacter]|uniref:LexA family protein n=1 Tax=Modicisalibacter TaxID=574347 RepID=UPI00100C1BFB|nr:MULTISPECIES: translesion error-prone DNA polymerase V autoproteolytic subunit [Halomonadaceae]MBZ9558112.1 translesion error-prone DNA polymerase V autoproteolytic subunit [Modicisalibacter sp. R2A 31.J]MBZ9573219.1 translesion error-prone DNA polymerase V autoproteolytic subunit [Modicisalibacter sp. MOD 31.J]
MSPPTLYRPQRPASALGLPYPETLIRAGLSGFPSPAQDYEGRQLDLNEHLIKRPSATFFMRVTGDSMEAFDMYADDLLIIDRSLDPRPGHIVAALVDGELIVKRYEILDTRHCLTSGNPRYAPIPLDSCDCQVWGVIRAVIHEYPV